MNIRNAVPSTASSVAGTSRPARTLAATLALRLF